MKNRLICLSLALVALPATAHADAQAVKKAADKLLNFGHAVADMKSKGAEVARYGFLEPDPSKCTDALTEAEKAGETRLYAFGWPDTLPSYKYESSIGSSITLAAAREVCADYEIWKPAVKAAALVEAAAVYLKSANEGHGGLGAYVIEEGKTCLAAIDALDPASRKLEVKAGESTMTLDEGRKVCQELVDRGGKAAKDQAAAAGAKRAEIEAKWKKVGMKGDRLALFVDNELNGGGFPWYAKGCETEIKDPKKLAKAKVLFNWTAGANGGTLVTKIVFKGNKYKESSREFFDESKAYRWCK
jgi:hypothetical protein